MSKRVSALVGFLGAAVVLGAASVAWACTTFATISLSSASGPANSEVTVKGTSAAANAPVTLRWDSRIAAPVAQAVTDADGNFSVPVRVPDTGMGVHFLVAIDSRGDVARGAFEVTTGAADKTFNAGAAPGSTTATATVEPNEWLRTGLIGFALGMMVLVPLGGLALLARPRVRVGER